MVETRVAWRETEALRTQVLGWRPGAVPGDTDLGAIHLAEVEDGAIVAAVSFVPHPLPDRETEPATYFWGMAVSPSHQRSGLGTRLLDRVLTESRSRGDVVVWADARLSAVPFYERLGGSAIGAVEHDEISGLDGQRMTFEL